MTYEVFGMPCLAHRCQTFLKNWCVTCGTFGGEQCVVVGIAIRQSVLFAKIVQMKRFVALNTSKALGMPILAQSFDHFISNRSFACPTLWHKQFVVVMQTVRLAILFLESVWRQLNATFGALEAVRMPLTAHRFQRLFLDGQIACVAFGRK